MTIRTTLPPAAKRGLVLSALMVSLGGCGMLGSVMESDKLDYRAAKKAAPLDVPPDLTQLQKDNRYAVPDGRGVATASTYQQQINGASALHLAPLRVPRSLPARRSVLPPLPASRSSAMATSAGWWCARARNNCGRNCSNSGMTPVSPLPVNRPLPA